MEEKSKLCLQHLSEIIHLSKTISQYERVFHLIVYHLFNIYKCQSCAIVLINPKTEYLNIVNSQGLSHTFCNEYRRRLATGAIGKLLWTGQPILISDSESTPQLAEEIQLENKFNSCICVQLAIDHRTLGYLFADSKFKNNFNEEDIMIFQLFADLASLAYHKYCLCEENMRLDKLDRETETEKYSSFIQKVNASLSHAKESSEPFSIILLDVDNMKNIINTYGNQIAVELLKSINNLIRNNFSNVSCVGRYGFDELIVLLDKTPLTEARIIAENLRDKIEQKVFTSKNINTTVSIGISSFPQNAKTLDDLLITSKNALFEAQRLGKNRVFFFEKEWYSK